MDYKEIVFFVLGGLGLFLYGINLMGNSLKDLAGNKMRTIIEKTTNTPIKGVLVGILVTALIQSSSGTTALVVTLVGAGLMTLPQAAGVIIGANVGNVVTTFLNSFKIGEYMLPVIFVGAVMMFFFKKQRIKLLGTCIFGFGALFYGLNMMGDGMSQLKNSQTAVEIFKTISNNPILGLLVGTLVTAIIQSSAASLGIVQGLYAGGIISLTGAIPIIIGANIGTTVTAVIASLSGSVVSKRAAFFHVMFNVIGATLCMILLIPFASLVEIIESNILVRMNQTPEFTIAVAHLMFNLFSGIVVFIFINQIVKMAEKFITTGAKDPISRELEKRTLVTESPAMALEFVKRIIDDMGHQVERFFEITVSYSFDDNHKLYEEGMKIEDSLDEIDKKLHDYLIELTHSSMSISLSHVLAKYLDTIRDFERMGDHCTNIMEFFEQRYADNQQLSEEGIHDLNKMFIELTSMIDLAVKALVDNDKEKASLIADKEDHVDKMQEKYRRRHILRLNSGQCKISASDNFVDILSNLERIGDHCNNIADNVMSDIYFVEPDEDFHNN